MRTTVCFTGHATRFKSKKCQNFFKILEGNENFRKFPARRCRKMKRGMLQSKDSKLWTKCCSLICLTYNLWSFVLSNRCQETKQFQRVTESNPPVREQWRPEIICKTYQTATLGPENLRVQHFTILVQIFP